MGDDRGFHGTLPSDGAYSGLQVEVGSGPSAWSTPTSSGDSFQECDGSCGDTDSLGPDTTQDELNPGREFLHSAGSSQS